MMRFAIPTAGGKLTPHFGHCQEFALIEVDGDEIKNKKTLVPPHHEPGVLPRWLYEIGTHVVIAGGMGARAIDLLTQHGVKVITGAPSLAPEELVKSYLDDTLKIGANVCDH